MDLKRLPKKLSAIATVISMLLLNMPLIAHATPHMEIEGNKEVSGDYSGYNGSEPKYEGSHEYVPREGGVFVIREGAHLTVTGGTYANNTTKSLYGNDGSTYGGKGGGAIATETSSNGKVTGHLTIQGAVNDYVHFTGNTAASVGGGAIYAGSVDLIDYAWFNANIGTVNPYLASYPSSIGGGAIYLDLENGATNTVISNSVFQNNVTSLLAGRANKGGAIYVSGSSVNNYHIDFINDSFSNNITGQGSQTVDTDIDNYNYGEGGAIHFSGMGDDSATIAGSEFIQNKAAEGGAIYGYTAPTLTIQAGTNLDGSQKRTTFSENLATKRGGAIFHSGNDLHISDTDFTGNSVIGKNDSASSVDGGGAIYYVGSSASRPHYATIENSIFDNNVVENRVTDENRLNSATALGGALHFRDSSYGVTSITDTTFTNNSASVVNRAFEDSSSAYMSSGGAAYLLTKSFNGDNLTFIGNSADIAGGMYLDGSVYSVIDHSTFQSNTAKYRGGAAYLYVPGYDYLVIRNSTIGGDKAELGNSAQYGGGLYLNTGANIENSTIMNNTASKTGGGIYSGTAVKIKDSTIAYNNAPVGAAIYNYNSGHDTSKISLDNVKIYNNTGGSAIAGRTMYFVNSDIYNNNAGSGSNVIDAINGILIDTNVVNNTGKYSINASVNYQDIYIQAINRDVLIDNPDTQGLNILIPIHLFAADNHTITIKDDSRNGIMYQYDGVVNYDGSIINDPRYIGDGLELYNGVANINAEMDASIYQRGGVLNLNNNLVDNRGLTIEGDAVANLSSKNEGLSFLRLRSSDGALVNIDGDKNIGTLASVYPTYNAIDTTLDNAITSVNIGAYTNYMGLSEKDELHLNLDADFSTAAIDKYTIDLLKIDTIEKNKYADIVFSVDRVNNLSSTDLGDGESKKFKFLQINEMQNDSGRPISDEYVRVGLGRINDTEMTEYYTDKSYNYLVDDSDLGTIKITKGSGLSLDSAIKNEVNSKMYTLKEDYKSTASLGSINGGYLGINGEGYGMDGRDSSNNYAEGITVNEGQLLVLNDVGSLNPDGTAKQKLVGFKNADGGFIANEQGSVEINNSVIVDNDSMSSIVSATSESVETNTKIKNSAFLNNKKISSGLVVNKGDLAALTVKDTTFKNNDGYAIVNSGNATVNDTTFDSNSSAINNSGTISVLDADFINNIGTDKIATIVNSGTMKLTQVNIKGNQGQYGAIYNAADSNGSAKITISSPYTNSHAISGNKDINGNPVAIYNSAYVGDDGTINSAEVVFTNYDYDAATYFGDFKGISGFVIDDKITGHDGDDYIANQKLTFADTGLYEVNNVIENNTLALSSSATLTLGNGGEIADSVIFSSGNNATLNITEGAKATFSGADNIGRTNINLQGGELVIGVDNSGNQLTKSTRLNVNGGILDIANGATGSISVGDSGYGTTTELKLDVDLANGKTDYLSSSLSSLSPVVISTINFISDATTETSVTITNTGAGAGAYAISVADDVVFTNTNSDYQVSYDPSRGRLTFVPLDLYDNIYAAVTNTEKAVRSYSLKDGGSGAEIVTQPLGTLVGTSLTVNGKNLALDGNSTEGIQITDGQTFALNNVKEVRNFSDAAVKNASGGTVEIATTAFTNNGTTDIINEGTLNLTSGNVKFQKGVTGAGTTNVTGAKVTLEDGASIAQALNIESGSLTSSADGIAGAVENNVANGLVLNKGTLSQSITGSGSTKIAGNVINSSTINQAVNITSGSLTTSADGLGGAISNSVNKGLILNGGTLAQNVTGSGTTVIDGDVTLNSIISQAAVVNASKSLTTTADNINKALTNNGTVNLNGGTLAQTITGSGTTVIDGDVALNTIISQATVVNTAKSLTTNADNIGFALTNNGTVNLNGGTLAQTITGSGTTAIGGDVVLANNLTNQNIEITNGSLIANSTTDYIGNTNNLTIKNDGILDLSSEDKSINTVVVNDFTVDGSATANSGIKFDVNFDGANVSNDKVSVAGTATGNLNIQSVNVKGDFDGDIDSTKTFNLVEGSNISGLNLISDSIRTVTGQYAYDFTAGANDGELIVTKTNGMTLQEAIGQKGVDYNVTSYSLSKDYTAVSSLGTLAGDNRNFTIYGNKNDIIANGNNIYGIFLDEGQTLTIDKVGDISDPNSKGFSGFYSGDFYSVIDNWRGGTINISDSVFSDNSPNLYGATVYNIGEVNITNSIFRDNGVAISNGALINSINPEAQFVEDLGVANITDTDFINNESDYGAIGNIGTMSIVAQGKDVLFSGNNNRTTAGGAIYNSNENLPLAGLGVLNLNAKNGHKITFAEATDSANNNIYNDATINLNEGNIEILSAITDAVTQRGTTNIGTKDTTATVVANAITQKALNINNGSSLAIDADGLKIADTINNLGSIALGDGTLTSAIGGTNGTTVINGAVVANSAIAQAITVNTDKSLTTSANNIGGVVSNQGTLTLNDGTLSQTVSGNGSTVIDGVVIANSAISQAITVNADKSLTASADNIGGAVSNQGTLTLNDGTLAQTVSGTGSTIIAGDITANSAISQAITVNADKSLTASADNIGGVVTNAGTLTLNDGTLAQTVSGTGSTIIAGDITANSAISQAITVNENKSLTASADNIGGAVSNQGILTLNDGTLAQTVSGNGSTVIAGDVTANSLISQAITVNENKSLTASADNIGGTVSNQGTLTLNDGTLAQAVNGNGTTQITGTVTNNASIGQDLTIANGGKLTSNLANISGTVTNEGTFNLVDNLSKDILGNGTTVLQNDIALAEDRTIDGTLNLNSKNIDMGNEPAVYNTLTAGNLTGSANLKIDVDFTNNSGKAADNDRINITDGTGNNATINLTTINVQNKLATSENIYSDYIDYVTGNNSNITYQLSGSDNGNLIVVTTEQKYTFTKGNDGSLNVLAQDYTGGLSDYITGEITANNFSINKNTTLNDNENIGLTQGTDTTKNVFINNGATLTGFDGKDKYNNGITIADGYTLNLTGSENAAMENFIIALENNEGGILNIEDMNFENNNKDIVNAGTLNLAGTNSFANGIEGSGSTNISSGTTTNKGTITQNTVSILDGATLNTNATNLIADSGVTNAGTLELTGGAVQSNITGEGTLSILENVTNDKIITQAITNVADNKTFTNDGVLNTSIALSANQTIDGQGTLNLTGTSTNAGSVTQDVVFVNNESALTNTGSLIAATVNNAGIINTDADTIIADINNLGTLELTGGNNANTINGSGTTKIVGSVENTTGTISQAVSVESGSLTTTANALGGTITNTVDNGLILNGGTLSQAVTGVGSTVIDGDVTANSAISQAITINTDKSLTTKADNIGGVVANKGTLDLNGGTLTNAVTGAGSTTISNAVIANADITQNNVTINDVLTNNATLSAGTIDLNSNILGTGDLSLTGTNDLSGNTNTITQNSVINTGDLIANIGQINLTDGMTNNSNLNLKGGVDSALENKLAISGSGTTTFTDKVKNSADIEQTTVSNAGELTNTGSITASVDNSGTLTSSADNIIGTVDNTGTYNIQGGTIANAISGNGIINISDAVTSNVQNTLTGEVNILENATLALGSGQTELFASANSVNAQNGSTINLINGSSATTNMNNLVIATGDNVNLQIDWKDSFDLTSTNINGNLNLSKVDLTGQTTDESYVLSNINNLNLSENIQLISDTNFNNYLELENGVLGTSKINLADAVNNKDAQNRVYQLTGNEEVLSDLGTMAGTDSTLIVNGAGNEIKGSDNAGAKIDAGNTLTFNNIKNIDGFKDDLFATNEGTINLSNVTLSDKIQGSGVVNVNGSSTINNSITNAINLNSGYLTLGQTGDLSQAASLVANGGGLSLQNGAIQNTNLGSLVLNNDLNLKLDGNFANQTLDTIAASSFEANGNNINISNINVLSATTQKSFSMSPLGEGMDSAVRDALAGAIQYTGSDITYGSIYKYTASYDPTTAMFNFGLAGGGGYESYNPSVVAAPVAAQLGGYLSQLNSYDNAFRNMDMYMLMTKKDRLLMKNRNKYASIADNNIIFDPTVSQYENKAGWFRPYATFENVPLNNGPKVSNVAYGSYFGADSELYDLGHGWDGMWSVYGGYNGSHQSYDGVSIYQNGGTLGAVGMAYKGNFFTGLTANVGANSGIASTMFGREDFAMLMTGIASKTGYNIELAKGKFIIQPNFLMSYSFINTFDYRNAAGVSIDSDPLHAIQLEPGIKFIGNLKNGWQPYAGVSVVWNIMDRTHFTANDVSLPNLSIDPFVKYGVGIRKAWGERFTGFVQAYVTNGGRNGVGIQAGFRWALGKVKSNPIKASGSIPELPKAQVTLNNIK